MHTHTKTNSPIEALRKPVSRLAVVALGLLVVFTRPAGLGGVHAPGFVEPLWEELCELAGYTLLIFAVFGRIWCSIYISGRKDKILCKEGPYSLSRNPLYFFSFLGVFGFALALNRFAILAVVAVAFLIYYYFVIRSEEVRLKELFGGEYSDYIKSTPRFFPAFRAMKRVDSCTIRPGIIERALKEVIWFLLAIIAIEMLELAHQRGYLVFAELPF